MPSHLTSVRTETWYDLFAQIAGVAGGLGQRVLSGSFLPFLLATVPQEGATSGRSVAAPAHAPAVAAPFGAAGGPGPLGTVGFILLLRQSSSEAHRAQGIQAEKARGTI